MPIFILMLAIYFKRYKEGFLFLIFHLIPLVSWYLWVTQVFKLKFYENAIENFDSGVWILNIPTWPWYKIYQTFISILPQFLSAIIYAFLLIPLIFAIFGFKRLNLKNKEFIYFGFFFSSLLVAFVYNFYFARHAFLLFPLIYPLTILGIDRVADFLRQHKPRYATYFYLIIFTFLVIISNIDIYKVFSYL